MKLSPLFQKLGLVITKTEATNRPEIKLLEEMAMKATKDPETYKAPPGYKVVTETHKHVEHRVPADLPIGEATKIATEVVDDMLFKGFGFHFLEAISIEKSHLRVVPDILSRRKIIPNTGKFTANYEKNLSSDQLERKKENEAK